MFEFLNRSGSAYYEPIRDLLEAWLDRMPAEHRAGIVGALSDSDAKFDSAFWELYLYASASGSGSRVEIHPDVPGTTRHPDFLVHDRAPYYLEAISVGRRPEDVAADKRRAEVEAVLDGVRVHGVTLNYEYHDVGSRPISAAKLRDQLTSWIASLEVQSKDWRASALAAGSIQPTYWFDDDGWLLKFDALPTSGDSPLIGIRGPGMAQGVNNVQGLRRALDAKAKRYGTTLPHPLVTAILSNTDYETRDYEVSEALYGSSSSSPGATASDILYSEGHWRAAAGWRRSHNPSVIVASSLSLHNLASHIPTLWSTLDPNATPVDVPWADPIDVSRRGLQSSGRSPALVALGIDSSWCTGRPDFE